MSSIRCIIIEDEPLAAKLLSDYVKELNFLDLKGVFRDALSATSYLSEHDVDLIFLDIHLPKLKGIAFLKTLVRPPSIIITSAYHEYAVEGFELNVTDYLLKPFEFERFVTAVNKVQAARSGRSTSETDDHIFVMVQKKNVKVMFGEILYIESQREYVKIVTPTHELLTRLSTSEMEELLPPNKFRRIHRSYIVSLERITSYTSESVELSGREIPIGRDFRGVIENVLRGSR
jgi:two-component system, LytTR family, response regulator